MPKKIKLLIACREVFSCSDITDVISNKKDFVVVKRASNLDDTFRWAKKSDPDILFLCSHFLIEYGMDIIAKTIEKTKRTKVVIFNSHFAQDQEILLAMEGVVGIFSCNLRPPALIKALKKVHEGELWFRRRLISSLIGDRRLDSYNYNVNISEKDNPHLTKRELEVLSLVAKGYDNRKISSRLSISELTVKTHIHNIFGKLKVNNRPQAIFYARNYVLKRKTL
jgi:DNA-binding NarL/FixJ family response regulator